jgi:hypothetical protein
MTLPPSVSTFDYLYNHLGNKETFSIFCIDVSTDDLDLDSRITTDIAISDIYKTIGAQYSHITHARELQLSLLYKVNTLHLLHTPYYWTYESLDGGDDSSGENVDELFKRPHILELKILGTDEYSAIEARVKIYVYGTNVKSLVPRLQTSEFLFGGV